MDPFDWTKDKAIYQRWQLWSERLDSPLMPWKVTQKGLKSLTSIIGLMEKEWDTLSHGNTAKTLIHQFAYDELEEEEKEGKYSSESIESYFTLFKLLLTPKSNPLLAVEELHFAKYDIWRISFPYC